MKQVRAYSKRIGYLLIDERVFIPPLVRSRCVSSFF